MRGTVKRRQVVYPPVMRTKADGLRPVRDRSYLGQPARRHRAGLVPYRKARPSNSASCPSLFDEHLVPLLPVKPIYFLRSNTPLRRSSHVIYAFTILI